MFFTEAIISINAPNLNYGAFIETHIFGSANKVAYH